MCLRSPSERPSHGLLEYGIPTRLTAFSPEAGPARPRLLPGEEMAVAEESRAGQIEQAIREVAGVDVTVEDADGVIMLEAGHHDNVRGGRGNHPRRSDTGDLGNDHVDVERSDCVAAKLAELGLFRSAPLQEPV